METAAIVAEKRALPLPSRLIRFVLTHPGALRLKAGLRDNYWRVRGRALCNPPLPTRPESILFICLGNICRSPFAEAIAVSLLKNAGVAGVTCASAGIRTTQAARPPELACIAAARFGISLKEHQPVTLTPELLARFALVVVMEASQLEVLRTDYPDAASRIVLLPLFDVASVPGYAAYNIADPFGRPIETFVHCYERVENAVRALLGDVGHLQATQRQGA